VTYTDVVRLEDLVATVDATAYTTTQLVPEKPSDSAHNAEHEAKDRETAGW
jgi:hypothetical protein